ncbi:PilW family protein [Roseateles sp.]|uniref:PilW family protein n=1 Tax=Roseateles sp. TaxID=1971397 RepID=UPI003BA64BD5
MTRATTLKLSVRGRAGVAGFSLIELMVGLAIGLLCTLVIATVLSSAEGQRRGVTQGSDAQVAGSLALYALQREIAVAGYGFASESAAVGCQLQTRFNGAVPVLMPTVLAPVQITQGVNGAPDRIRVLASSKMINPAAATLSTVGYTAPARIVPPYYDGVTVKDRYNVWSELSVANGDLMVAVVDSVTPCGLFQVTGAPTAGVIPRADVPALWNPAGQPAQTVKDGSFLVNLGRLIDVTFSVDANQKLVANRLDTQTLTAPTTELQSNIVQLKALYGRDTDGDLAVDTYDYTTPANNAGWLQVLTVRLVVVARNSQYEKEEVTFSAPQWDVGAATAVAGAASCGSSKCVNLKVDGDANWKHYRYKVFDTIVPLRNQRWK